MPPQQAMRLEGRNREVENEALTGVDQSPDNLVIMASGIHVRAVEVNIGTGRAAVDGSTMIGQTIV